MVLTWSQVYEKLLFSRLWSWFSRSRIFRLPQFGFRPKSSTIDAIFVLLGLVRQHTVVLKQPLYVAFVDITKAFPSLNRRKLFGRFVAKALLLCVLDSCVSRYKSPIIILYSQISRQIVLLLDRCVSRYKSPFLILYSQVSRQIVLLFRARKRRGSRCK